MFLPPGQARFDKWFHAPVPCASSDPRLEVRPAHPAEFERIDEPAIQQLDRWQFLAGDIDTL